MGKWVPFAGSFVPFTESLLTDPLLLISAVTVGGQYSIGSLTETIEGVYVLQSLKHKLKKEKSFCLKLRSVQSASYTSAASMH